MRSWRMRRNSSTWHGFSMSFWRMWISGKDRKCDCWNEKKKVRGVIFETNIKTDRKTDGKAGRQTSGDTGA